MYQDRGSFYWFFSRVFFAYLRRNINFYLAESSYFCVSQQKKRAAKKEMVKRSAISGHVNRLQVTLVLRMIESTSGHTLMLASSLPNLVSLKNVARLRNSMLE